MYVYLWQYMLFYVFWYLSLCIYLHVCMSTCMYTYVWVWARVCTCAYLLSSHTHTHTTMCVCVFARTSLSEPCWYYNCQDQKHSGLLSKIKDTWLYSTEGLAWSLICDNVLPELWNVLHFSIARWMLNWKKLEFFKIPIFKGQYFVKLCILIEATPDWWGD